MDAYRQTGPGGLPLGLASSEGLGFTGQQEQSHGYVIYAAATAEANPLLEAPFLDEA